MEIFIFVLEVVVLVVEFIKFVGRVKCLMLLKIFWKI